MELPDTAFVLDHEKLDARLSALALVCSEPRGCVAFKADFYAGQITRLVIVVDSRLKERVAKALSHLVKVNGGTHEPF